MDVFLRELNDSTRVSKGSDSLLICKIECLCFYYPFRKKVLDKVLLEKFKHASGVICMVFSKYHCILPPFQPSSFFMDLIPNIGRL